MAPIIHLDPWADTDLPLLRRLLGDPAMMEHLGGPETEEQIVARQARYMASADPVFRITDEATGEGIGWVGYPPPPPARLPGRRQPRVQRHLPQAGLHAARAV